MPLPTSAPGLSAGFRFRFGFGASTNGAVCIRSMTMSVPCTRPPLRCCDLSRRPASPLRAVGAAVALPSCARIPALNPPDHPKLLKLRNFSARRAPSSPRSAPQTSSGELRRRAGEGGRWGYLSSPLFHACRFATAFHPDGTCIASASADQTIKALPPCSHVARCMQHASCNMQATCNSCMQHAKRTACSMQHATWTRRSTHSLPPPPPRSLRLKCTARRWRVRALRLCASL